MHCANTLNVNGLSLVSIKRKYDFMTSYDSMTLNVVYLYKETSLSISENWNISNSEFERSCDHKNIYQTTSKIIITEKVCSRQNWQP